MKENRELNYMNAIGCLCVILIHVLSIGITRVESASWQAAVIYFPWRVSAFVVPMFLYTGAIKMAGQFAGQRITLNVYLSYCGHRIRKIYIPYAIWVAIYFVCFIPIYYVRGELGEFLSYLFVGNIASPFYYIIIVMQFYFLMPVWIWMIQHIPAHLAVLVSLLITLFMNQFPQILSHFGLSFPYSDRMFPTYLIFWTVGLYVGKDYKKLALALGKSAGMVLACVVIFTCCALGYVNYSGRVSIYNLNEIKLISDLLSIAVIQFACLKLTHAAAPLQSVLQRLYESSFFVFLSHCLFLTIATDFLLRNAINQISVLLLVRFCVCYTIPFGLHWLYKSLAARLWTNQKLKGSQGR